MVTCKKCGYVGEYTSEPCPLCNTKLALTKEELNSEFEQLRTAIKYKNFNYAAEGYRMLADDGYTEAEKEYAQILEKGQIVQKDYNLAQRPLHFLQM